MDVKAKIDEQWATRGGYADVVLVAHSMGGPLLRQAYLLAAGASAGAGPSEWSDRVSRFVLFASINRGIDTKRIWWLPIGAWLVRNFPMLSSLRLADLYRGSDFLTNLRIDWIRHMAELAQEVAAGEKWSDGRSKQVPTVVQLVGTADSLVQRDDSRDLLVLGDAHIVDVAGADHEDIYRVDDVEANGRYAVIRGAFCDTIAERDRKGNRVAPRAPFGVPSARHTRIERGGVDQGTRRGDSPERVGLTRRG